MCEGINIEAICTFTWLFYEHEVWKQFIPHFSNICVFHKSYLHIFYGKIAPLTASVIKESLQICSLIN